jgi:protein tyrosine/serine phosphatase
MTGKRRAMRRLIESLRRRKTEFHDSFSGEIVTDADRRRSQLYVDWIDHGILRAFWHNFHEVAPGVFRSNHPDHRRLARYAKRGIRTILTFRGEVTKPFHRFEEESCAALGLDLHRIRMTARAAPRREALLQLLDFFDTAPRPFLMHCKSGADRSSLASALYLIHREGATVAEARAQMSVRYIHFRWTATGILDEVLDAYEERLRQGPIALREWIADEYDRDEITRRFTQRRRGRGAAVPEEQDP